MQQSKQDDNIFPEHWSVFSADVALLWLIFAVMYFYELSSFPLSIDEELAAFRHLSDGAAAIWVQQGRWGSYLFERFLFPQPSVPYLPAALFGLGLAICFRVLLAATGIRGRIHSILLITFAIFCAFPTWVFLIEFYSNAGACGLGVALSSLAIWLLFSEDIKTRSDKMIYVVCSVVATTLAISIYQSLFFLVFSLGVTALLFRAIEGDDVTKICRKFAFLLATLLASLILYKILDRAFLAVLGLDPAYTSQFLQLDALLTDPITTLGDTLEHMAGIYGLYDHLYLTRLWTIPVVLALGIAGLFMLAFHPLYAKGKRIQIVGLGLIVFLSPFLIDLVSKGLPTRAIVGAPVAVWCFAFLALKNQGVLRTAALFATFAMILQLLVFSNTMSAAGHFSGVHDQAIATRLYERISTAAPNFSTAKQYKLVVFGGIQTKSNYSIPPWSTVGGSFFGWDGGNPTRIVDYLSLLGFDNLQPTDRATLVKYTPQLEEMPVFPAVGSVAVDEKNDVVMVRLGKEPSEENMAAQLEIENPVGFGADPASLLFRLNDKHFTTEHGDLSWDAGSIIFATKQDPMLLLDLSDKKDKLANCHKLQVSVSLSTGRADRMQVFYQTPSDKSFSEDKSKSVTYREKAETYIFLKSKDGFASDLRFDPGDGNIVYKINDLEVRCRG